MKTPRPVRGRGSAGNPKNRFEAIERIPQPADDNDDTSSPHTQFLNDSSKSIIAYNDSPDVGFDASVNAYRGCEHGCVYCYARPTHAYHDLSPGVDFESRLFVKPNAAQLLHVALSRPGYECRPIAMGTNTDPYQPIEERWRITRSVV